MKYMNKYRRVWDFAPVDVIWMLSSQTGARAIPSASQSTAMSSSRVSGPLGAHYCFPPCFDGSADTEKQRYVFSGDRFFSMHL